MAVISHTQFLSKERSPSRATQTVAFFWLSAFYFVYCARPEDWVPLMGHVSLAKITGLFVLLAMIFTAGRGPRSINNLPKEVYYLFLLTVILFASSVLSPVWKGGAFWATVDFAKVIVAWIATFLLVTTLARFRRIVFVQAASVVVISIVALTNARSSPRLGSVLGGIYSNPNDLAIAIVLCLPFCLAFLLSAKTAPRKLIWCVAILPMMAALFLTGSRSGFIDLIVSGAVLLWHFGIKGNRPQLILGTGLIGVLLFVLFGHVVMERFSAISDSTVSSETEEVALASYEERRLSMEKALDAIANYPILGVGTTNFETYSGMWREVHMSYLQIAAEGGIPALIVYLLYFGRGFTNLRRLRRMQPDSETVLFAGAAHSSLVGFVVGACFAPVAYLYFPYFAVCYTSVLLAMAKEKAPAAETASPRFRFASVDLKNRRSRALIS
jgi:O-antigen ligase